MKKPDDAYFMRLALEEAEKGKGRTSPNPCVGAVIVRGDTVVGRGYHRRAGTPHAEVNAIEDAGDACSGATIYVTLEPCNHTGRTPPCTRAILAAGIDRVVIGTPDPNPSVTGGGATFLKSQGVTVKTGIMEEACRELILPFFKHSSTGLPWVVMKAGMSLDGRISYLAGAGGKITGTESRRMTHHLRNTLDAILVGVDTAVIDNPSLTTRLPDAVSARDPLRVILDTSLRLSPDAKVLQQESSGATWIYCGPDASSASEQHLTAAGAVVHRINLDRAGHVDAAKVLLHLGRQGITSVLVEGGGTVHGTLLGSDLVDEVYLFVAPLFIGDQGAPMIKGPLVPERDECPALCRCHCRRLGDDLMVHGYTRGSLFS